MSKTKTYWKGYSEKHQTPDFVSSSNKEFREEIPVGEFLSSNEATDLKSDRRDFLKFMGFSLAAASLASCESAVIKSIPYVNKPEEITPGVANWYSSTYYDGNDFANLLVKSREGRPIWLKGKRDGYTQGGLIPRISTSILNLYNSSRLEGPLQNKTLKPWSDIDKNVSSKLKEIISRNGEIRILSNTIISPSTNAVIKNFIDSFSKETGSSPKIKHIEYDAQSYYGIRKANENNFGSNFIPSYNFEAAKTLVSINADFLCNWILPSKFSTDFSKTRKPENGWMSKHFHFESVMSLSGANADYRGQIKPSQELDLAQEILNVLNGKPLNNQFNGDTNSKIIKAVECLKKHRASSLVIAGSNDPNVQMVVNKINYELGNYGETINTENQIQLYKGDDLLVKEFKDELLSGGLDGVIFYGTNPVYSHPDGKEMRGAIANLDLSLSFSEYMDETASNCKFVCPDHNFLEAWCDHNPVSNHFSIQQPLIRPLYNSRQAQESLLVWAGSASRTNSESEVFYDFIQNYWLENRIGDQASYFDFSEFWNWTIHNGFSNSDRNLVKSPINFKDIKVKSFNNNNSEDWEFVIYQKELGVGHHAANPWLQELPDAISKIVWDNYITMSPSDCYKVFGIDNSNQKSAWDGIHLGQEEKAFVARLITTEGKELKLPVYPLPGQTSGTIGISMGYGRGENNEDIGKAAYQCDEYGNHLDDGNGGLVPIGGNAFRLCNFKDGHLSYNGFGDVNATDERYSLAGTQTHHTIMGRTSIVKETTFDFWKDNFENNQEAYNPKIKLHSKEKGAHVEKDATEYSLWDEHPVESVGHRWGMSIDLTSCNGCGVCITACHSENNVPVVGKDEVRRARDMHWLRMDRYFSSVEDDNRKSWEKAKHEGDFNYADLEIPEENPSVVFMPMLCQHCNHAPCETVCPVAATTHSNEGLNMMTYNRCIGTRYCANNCPYKVRRFNWFNYRDYRKFKNINPNQDTMARMVLNPDVVVRSRGVMEKCSFCVQGIQAAKLQAKKEGRKVADGDVMCACGDACPNDCIVFGDWNDPESKVRKASNSDRAYQALEEVGVKPNIWYQVKIRNNEDDLVASSNASVSHSDQT